MPGSRRVSSTLMLLCALSLLAHAALARAQAPTNPDFSNVGDILQGRRTLFPVDDIVVTFNGVGQSTISTILQTTGDAISGQVQFTASATPLGQPTLTAAVRMFNLPRDVVVTLLAGSANLHDQAAGFNQSFPNAVNPRLANTYAVTDLIGNGFAAIAFIGSIPQQAVPNVPFGVVGTVMAANVNDLGQGFFYGTPVPLPPVGGSFGIAAGDFDGDGANEVAVAYSAACSSPSPDCSGNVIVAIFKPQVTTDAKGNVTALTLQEVGSATIAIPEFGAGTMALTAGRYSGGTRRELVLVYNGAPTIVQPISVSPTSDPMQVTLTLATPFTLDQHNYAFISAQSGPLDFFENTDQVVLLLQSIAFDSALVVLTFDSQLNASVASSLAVPAAQASLQLGMALGNFDQPNTDVNPLALEIAAVLQTTGPGCASGDALMVQIYHVDPSSNFALSAGASALLAASCLRDLNGLAVGLATGDTQGRSLVLGPPSKLTAQHIQPELILGAPPMHVDYVTPANSSHSIVLNLSAVPQGFNSSYQTAVSNQTQSSRQATTSYTNAVKTSDSVGVKFGTPLTGSVTAKVGASAGFMHQKSIQKRYGLYTSTAFDASTTTGFDDQVWFTDKTHYIFVYPVIGRTACPADDANCADPAPVLVMFSGPTVNLQESVGGANLEWYQPIHEVGSVFSYPWSLQQLQLAEGDINLLTASDPDGFATDSSTHTAQATWSGQQSTSVTSGSTSNISWGASVSVTEKAGIFGGIVGDQNFSYNGSKAISTLNTLTTQVGQSTGIGIVKPGTFPSPPLYQYPIFPYIFGDNPVPGTLQKLNLGTQVQTSGILRATYTANPTDPSAGAWWQGAYTLPDVALNHPSRWSVELVTPSSPQSNCIPTTAFSRNQDCVTFNRPEPDIWTSEFHYMKGLLITPAGVNGEGPQLTQAAAGAPLLLQTRVYNYSLADMPATSSIVVQFYGQPWHPNQLVSDGNAFLIDQVELAPLPGFNSVQSGGTTPNWALAGTTKLDTASYGDQYLVFWILVYMKNATGRLDAEMPGHGLTAIPPVLDSIAAATAYLESYSNNIGFYRSLFYIAPQGSAVSSNPGQAGLDMRAVDISASRVFLGDKVIISGLVHSANAADGLSVLFRDGTSTNKGKLFDVESISHIRADGTHRVKTVYRPSTCGTHVLSLQVMNTAAAGQATIEVTVDVLRAIEDLKALTSRIRHSDGFLQPLAAARAAFENGSPSAGVAALQQFKASVEAVLQPNVMTASLATLLLEKVDQVLSCVR